MIPRAPRLLLVTVFGLGRLRPASGTWGSLPPVVIAGAMLALGLGPSAPESWSAGAWITFHAVLLAILVVFSVACLVQGDAAEARFGRKDPGEVVADETAGQCIPLALLPPAALHDPARAALTLALAFLAFRALDIVKPPPARRLQSIPGGAGILIDDLVAGVYALVLVQILVRVALPWTP